MGDIRKSTILIKHQRLGFCLPILKKAPFSFIGY